MNVKGGEGNDLPNLEIPKRTWLETPSVVKINKGKVIGTILIKEPKTTQILMFTGLASERSFTSLRAGFSGCAWSAVFNREYA